MTTELIRKPLAHLAPIEDIALSTKCETLLGYSKLSEKVNVLGPLGIALANLQIEPFLASSVEAYQDETQKAKIDELRPTIPKHTNAYRNLWRNIRWDTTPIAEYKEKIPKFVLHKAVQIKEAIPDCELFVVGLIVETEPFDPFLLVRRGREEYYVEVWSEPNFEATL